MARGHPREPFWYTLTAAQRAELDRVGIRRTYERDGVLVREHDQTDFVIVVLDGCVKVTLHADRGYQAVLGLRDAGDLVGELAGMDRGCRSATLSALTPVECLIVPAARFREFLQQHPDAAEVVRRTVSGRLREADRHRVSAGAESVAQRLATLLLDLGRRYGSQGPGGDVLIELPLSQSDLAGLVLTSQRTLGRTLEQWRTEGWVVTRRRSVLIAQPVALRRIAGS